MAKSYHERKRTDGASSTPSNSSSSGPSSKATSSAQGEPQATEERLIEILRQRAQGYLRLPNVTSVGIGRRVRDGKETDELTIQFTVAKKLPEAELRLEGLTALPTQIEAMDGTTVPVDVIERSYRPSYRLLDEPGGGGAAESLSPEDEHDLRRERQETMVPGISIAHFSVTAGTLGAIVYDRETGRPLVLSNWHVLHGPAGNIGDAIVQPGPLDDPDAERNGAGRLLRAHLGLAGDCAVASIEGRAFSGEILGLGVTPRRAAKVNLGDRVVKSGRTTGVTRGVVSRVGVVVNINYDGTVGVQQVGGFEIKPDPAGPPLPRGEISMGGDSGSAWMIDGEESDVIVGLHFAGDDVPSPTVEYALACNIHSVLEKLDVTLDDPAADPQSHRERIDALAQQVAMLTARLAATASGGGGCSCGGHRTTDASAAAELGLPVYGRWCGPGHGGDGPPIDDVDRACMTHDNCYGSRGWGDCSCNRELQANIDAALRAGQVRPLGRVVGPIMRRWFDFQPCVNRGGGVGEAAGGSMLNGAMGNGAMLNATMINGMPPPGVRPSLRRSPPRAGLPAPQARGRHFQ